MIGQRGAPEAEPLEALGIARLSITLIIIAYVQLHIYIYIYVYTYTYTYTYTSPCKKFLSKCLFKTTC